MLRAQVWRPGHRQACAYQRASVVLAAQGVAFLVRKRRSYFIDCFIIKALGNHFSFRREWCELLAALSLTGVLVLLTNSRSRILKRQRLLIAACWCWLSSDEMKRRRDFYAEHPVDGKLFLLVLIWLFLITYVVSWSALVSRVFMLLLFYF